MRIIKKNTLEFPALYTTLVSSKSGSSGKTLKYNGRTEPEKNSHEELFDTLYSYGKKIKGTADIKAVVGYLETALNKFLEINELEFFYTIDEQAYPVALRENVKNHTRNFIRTIKDDGVLDKILSSGSMTLIPVRSKNSNVYTYYLVYPVVDPDRLNQNFLLLNTPDKNLDRGSFVRKSLQSLINLFVPRIEYLLQKLDLNKTYDELQVYQSKLSNDYKLSALGEMTYSLIDQIISPLQVVLSSVDVLEGRNEADESVISSIKTQIRKVQSITDTIVKFSSNEKDKLSVQPCALNGYITNFNNFVKSSFKSNNFEIILDLQSNLPPVISSPNYLQQILTNTFSLMADTSDTGGLYIMTKHFNGSVMLRALSTTYTEAESSGKSMRKNINLMMLESLMKKHEGSVKYSSTASEGSKLELIFPLKRKAIK